MDAFLSDIRVIGGPIPIVVVVLAVLAAAGLIIRRAPRGGPRRRWAATVLIALAVGATLGLLACWVVGDLDDGALADHIDRRWGLVSRRRSSGAGGERESRREDDRYQDGAAWLHASQYCQCDLPCTTQRLGDFERRDLIHRRLSSGGPGRVRGKTACRSVVDRPRARRSGRHPGSGRG